ncbi:hypothetical protein [Natronorarus salvus]|uniref:hypothetical protein n=1 Tax=Natronorarus salvus TaxID=3117733 RepID=UPI002F268474
MIQAMKIIVMGEVAEPDSCALLIATQIGMEAVGAHRERLNPLFHQVSFQQNEPTVQPQSIMGSQIAEAIR